MKNVLALAVVVALGITGVGFAAEGPDSSSPASNPPATSPSSSAYSSTSSSMSSTKIAADSTITSQVKSQLTTNKDLQGLSIDVTTTNGVVKLSGQVDNKNQIQKTVAVAKKVKGVKDVDSSGLTTRQ